MAKKRHSIFLEDEQVHVMETIRKESGTPVSEQIRRAIDSYLKKEEPK